ncbi:MAG: hypothetical protein AB1491_10085 [Thermodesulfobacteriota bacterium]
MALIHLPQDKWGSGTGRQVILKSDFDKVERALLESFELAQAPSLEYVDAAKVRVNATADCQARVMLCGFPSPLHRGLWVDGDLADGRYRENSTPLTLNFAESGSLWGTEKGNQWYCVYALAGSGETTFTLKALPVMRVSSQSTQIITLRNNGNSADIGYGFTANELVNGKVLVLTGASRGLLRLITGNNDDNETNGTITYGGSTLTLAQGDWFIVLPPTNFRYLGMVLNDAGSSLVPFFQEGRRFTYQSYRELAAGAINGFTLYDLCTAAPPTARSLSGYAAALEGADLKLALSYDGSTAALMVHGTPPTTALEGVRGAIPFNCRVPVSHALYLHNDNTANQSVRITGWEE